MFGFSFSLFVFEIEGRNMVVGSGCFFFDIVFSS